MNNAELECAVALLRAGQLVAFPTETVYGLGADAANPSAVARIFAAKGRPADHPLIVHLPDASHLPHWARELPPAAQRLAAAFWPGPLTLILKRRPNVPDLVTGGQDSVGLRVPGHAVAQALLHTFGGGIAAPSANRFGHISPTTAAHVHEELGSAVSLVLDGGPCEVGIESTIVDLTRDQPALLRPGAITAEQIEAVLGYTLDGGIARNVPRVSGSLASHYAPTTPLRLVQTGQVGQEVQRLQAQGKRIAVLARNAPPVGGAYLHWCLAPADPARYAHQIYSDLRQLDHLGADLILVEAPPEGPEWLAVRDRLVRAAHSSSV